MKPEVPNKERSPTPRRRWKPIDQPTPGAFAAAAECHMNESPTIAWGGH